MVNHSSKDHIESVFFEARNRPESERVAFLDGASVEIRIYGRPLRNC